MNQTWVVELQLGTRTVTQWSPRSRSSRLITVESRDTWLGPETGDRDRVMTGSCFACRRRASWRDPARYPGASPLQGCHSIGTYLPTFTTAMGNGAESSEQQGTLLLCVLTLLLPSVGTRRSPSFLHLHLHLHISSWQRQARRAHCPRVPILPARSCQTSGREHLAAAQNLVHNPPILRERSIARSRHCSESACSPAPPGNTVHICPYAHFLYFDGVGPT